MAKMFPSNIRRSLNNKRDSSETGLSMHCQASSRASDRGRLLLIHYPQSSSPLHLKNALIQCCGGQAFEVEKSYQNVLVD